MKNTLLAACVATGLAVAAFAPTFAHADGIGFNINLGADDNAHFHFNDGRHDPKIFRAAQALQNAKHLLWNDRRHQGPGRDRAIQHINQALDDLNWIENHRY